MSQSEFWNQRYALPEYAYGKEPNVFIQQQLDLLKPGKILFPAEGEGRNAIYAAIKGWDVTAFDISNEAQRKALQLATQQKVSIEYLVGTLDELAMANHYFDAIGLCFAHMPAEHRISWHRSLVKLLKPGGILMLQGFSKAHTTYQQLNPKAGGPKEVTMLFSKEELQVDFESLQIDILQEEVRLLQEGAFHQGESALINLVAHKPH
jgi:ubiquinone/menaquinone biosynthesis C-methylase UbiE